MQFDHIDMRMGSIGDKYVFMIRDDHSGCTWFYPTTGTDAEPAALALLDLCAAFGLPN